MSGRAFLDTNIFVYLLDVPGSKKGNISQRLIATLMPGSNGVISYQVEQEFFNVAFRRFHRRMTALEAEALHETLFGKLPSIGSSQELLLSGVRLKDRYQLVWYDALIVAAALQARCSILCSEDFQAGQVFEGSLTVVNPFANKS